MIQSKKINIIVAIAVAFSLLISIALVVLGNIQTENGNIKTEPEYATKIFGTDIISIEILADEADWQEMLDNATKEEYIMVDVVVNGTKFQKVGIRPKGNSSLMQVASSDSDRYSFRLKFDQYIKGQTCFGLESFVVNNMIGDNTYMKEYISYDLMKEIGVDAPYFGFADIKVNGENWGLYLAVELYNDSYEQRVYGNTSGMLYNVKSMDMGGGMPKIPGGNNMPMPGGQNRTQRPEGNFQPWPGGQENIQGNGGQSSNEDKSNVPAMPKGSKGQGMIGGNEGKQSVDTEESKAQDMPRGLGRQNNTQGNERSRLPNREKSNTQDLPVAPEEQGNGQSNQGEPFAPPVGGNNMPDINPPANMDASNFPAPPDGNFMGMGGGFKGRGGFGSNGGSLEYIDDNVESYSSIFNNVVGKGTESDYKRVVQAIKALSEGKDIEKYFDVDKILRYLAAHTIVVNLDSYSSNMAQNYYIYERDGKITILPWDYNLAWGGFQNGDASSVINFPIDTPVSGVEMSSRPLIDKLFANPEYLERYHSYLRQLIDNYFANGKFAEKVRELDSLILDYVKNDATAFCTYEEYKTAVSTFIKLGELRAQSVQGQLNGTIPSTSSEQKSNPEKLVQAEDLKLSDLGSMMGGRGGFPGRINGQDRNSSPGDAVQGMDFELMGKVMEIISKANGEISDEVKEELKSLGLTTEQVEQITSMAGGRFGGMMQNRENTTFPNGDRTSSDKSGNMEQFGRGRNIPQSFGSNIPTGQGVRKNNMTLIGVLSLVLVAAIIFAAKYKKSY